MAETVEGRLRESVDGLRRRRTVAEKARLKETQQRVAHEAASQREQRSQEFDPEIGHTTETNHDW